MIDSKEPIFIWEVLGSTPTGTSKTYPSYENLKFSVVARSMDRVMIVSRQTYPDMRFHSIQKRNYLGKESVLIDVEVKDG